jgi:hypothetical protein
MQHVMLDLETFGTQAGCVIRSVGMVMFDTQSNWMGEEYYANLTEEDQIAFGAHKDPGTIAWWSRQSSQAQQQLLINQKPFVSVATEITNFIKGNRGKFVWGQGANFDVVLLEQSLRMSGHKTPWLFYNTRDTRTAYQMAGFDTKSIVRQGTYHNALDDAKHQARCVQHSYRRMK